MMLKRDYSRTYELILAELQEDGHMNVVQYLEEHPPLKTKGTMYSIDIVNALIAAKESAQPMLTSLNLDDLDAVRPHSNLRQMLNKRDSGKWFNTLKSSILKRPMIIAKPPDAKFDDDTNLENWGDDGDDECNCDDAGCTMEAVYKHEQSGSQLCDEHFADAASKLGSSHGYQPWNCETDEYYQYREDL